MPMVWRVLYTLEHIVEQEGIDIGLSELSQLYNLVSHGSHRFLFKSKPQQAYPILKTTKNDSNWRNQFLFVRRDSIPNGSHLPKKWITHAISFSHIQEYPVTRERITAFWKLDPAIRTFQAKAKDSQEIFSGSYTMSSAAKSSKSASRLSVGGIQEYVSPRSIKKELAASQSIPETKGICTRGKGTKRKKPAEPTEGLPLMERQLLEYVSEKFAKVQILIDQHVAEAEQKSLDLQAIAVAKDKKISQLEKENKELQKVLLLAEMTAQRERIEAMEGAKHSAAIVMLKVKLQMAKEAADPSFDRSEWDLEGWTKRLAELRDDEEPEEVLALESGGSGAQDPEDAAAGGSGQGGDEKVDEAANV
ncbi:hypothetical protein HanPSC8_Chr01g0026111 [Helianthus annuus]|nr:hypothetical protein HanPSC8_Chr01g0026111 [Helianthus annuus]